MLWLQRFSPLDMFTRARKPRIPRRVRTGTTRLFAGRSAAAAERRFVASVVAVNVTPDVLARVEELTQRTRAAKQAPFLSRYRTVAA